MPQHLQRFDRMTIDQAQLDPGMGFLHDKLHAWMFENPEDNQAEVDDMAAYSAVIEVGVAAVVPPVAHRGATVTLGNAQTNRSF